MKKTISKYKEIALSQFLPDGATDLLTAKGVDLIEKIGQDAIREVLKDVFSGKNLRDSTEFLTRHRVSSLNLALVRMFVNGVHSSPNFLEDLPNRAVSLLSTKGTPKNEKWLAQWVLGLTDKASQNVLRDSSSALGDYKDRYVEVCSNIIEFAGANYGIAKGELCVGDSTVELSWSFLVALLNTVGSQTLAIRGSDKSAYGKLFEKLILGSLLTILGFKHSKDSLKVSDKTFWLSTTDKRESDATLLYEIGNGIRFDIGFIGRGNSEITLDKVSRFNRFAEIDETRYYMPTIIIVDRLGENSTVEQLAREIDGSVVQMSASYWLKNVAEAIKERNPTYNHEVLLLNDHEFDKYLDKSLRNINPLDFINGLEEDSE